MFLKPGVQATLALGNPVTAFDGPLEHAFVRARAEGTGGNAITVHFSDDSLGSGGDLLEDAIAKTVHVKFSPGDTTVQQIHDMLASGSALVELTGTWDPARTLQSDDDEFGPLNLSGGAAPRPSHTRFFGPLFPDISETVVDPSLIPGVGPEGAAQFALSIEGGFTVAYQWITDVFKAFDGTERRANVLRLPRQTYRGASFILSNSAHIVRAALQKFAALGSTFLLGLAHESIPVAAKATGKTIPVHSTALADWCVQGQRVAVVDDDGASTIAVIQLVTDTTIVIDKDPGAPAHLGATIMPLFPVLLDATQSFTRYRPSEEHLVQEQWSISARGVEFGFRSGVVPATLKLAGFSAAFANATVVARAPGILGNGIEFRLVSDSPGGVSVVDTGGTVVVHYEDNATTAGQLADQLALDSSSVSLAGSWDASQVLRGVNDDFPSQGLAGGADEQDAPVGRGATLASYLGKPVFDRGIDIEGSTAEEQVNTMATVVDLGGAPQAVGTATMPDWGRAVAIARSDDDATRQWLKLFLWTIRGSWRSFWLPTYRHDLLAIGDGSGGLTTGTIVIDANFGRFTSWYPQRTQIQVVQDSGTYYVQIQSYVDNGDGTITLSIVADTSNPDAIVPIAEPIERISWLELCRLATDEPRIVYKGAGFSFAEMGRTVQQ